MPFVTARQLFKMNAIRILWEEVHMAEIKSDYHGPINDALDDGTPCLMGTVSPDNTPEISPKGSVVVYGPDTLGYWERSHRGASTNIKSNSRVVFYYRNMAHINPTGIVAIGPEFDLDKPHDRDRLTAAA